MKYCLVISNSLNFHYGRMSIDAYFCFCCLSTNELTNLFSDKPDSNYADFLKDLFSIKPLQEEYEFDSYICEDCAKSLQDAHRLKRQVLDTLNVLQVNGLIIMNKTADHTIISKMPHEYPSDMEEKKTLDRVDDTELRVEIIQNLEYPNIIKLENSNTIILEREKRITVQRKKKREPVVAKEVLYEVTEDFKCKLCAAELPNLYTFHTHMNRHFPNHICETCGKGFLTKKRLKRHMPSHIKGPFKCEECDTEFQNYNTLSSHRQRKHKTIALYACPHCAERFATLTRRARHLAAAHGARAPHACHVCAKRFMLAGNLSTHIRNTHMRVKPHVCVECGAAFSQKQELRGHTAVHTGLNEFQCALCPKSYPRKKALDVHMRTHKDDRRFCCDKCGKKFLQKCTLLTHTKTHDKAERHVHRQLTVQS